MKPVAVIALVWAIHVLFAGLVAGPIIYVTRRRARFATWELLVLVLPFAAWAILSVLNLRMKSLANFVEPQFISVAIAVAAVLRVALVRVFSERALAMVLMLGVTVAAVAIYLVTPVLPETGGTKSAPTADK